MTTEYRLGCLFTVALCATGVLVGHAIGSTAGLPLGVMAGIATVDLFELLRGK